MLVKNAQFRIQGKAHLAIFRVKRKIKYNKVKPFT